MYENHWKHLNQLTLAAIVVAGGRVGSDFIQSLFDGHPEVLTFDGVLSFEDFYQNAISLWGTAIQFQVHRRLERAAPSDFFYEFAWKHLYAFKSNYDNLEGKHRLGMSRDEANQVDIEAFVRYGVQLLSGREWTSRNAFLALYGAFGLARGEDLSKKKVLLHHIHDMEKLPPLLEAFPNIKVIAATRDPRAGYLSTMEHTYRYSKEKVTPNMHAYVYARILRESDPLQGRPGMDVRVNLLERLHQSPETVLNNMCQWLGIPFHPVLLCSTWGGKEWWGDALSDEIRKTFNPEMYAASQKKWERNLSFQDRLLLEVLMRKKLRRYGYVIKYRASLWHLLAFPLIFWPNRIERKLLRENLKSFGAIRLLRWIQGLGRRYRCMLQRWIAVLRSGKESFEFF
ncbi:MAG: sulfotransferase [Deltaproteobacteria bacterium]|nr:sulfotransferase [Deltaproteobacteria bacterium]MBI4223738.1 sulfotransferase [Deltaproteobacteria bacterium]